MLSITTGSFAGGQDLDGPAYLPIGHPGEGCVQPLLQILQTGNEWKSQCGLDFGIDLRIMGIRVIPGNWNHVYHSKDWRGLGVNTFLIFIIFQDTLQLSLISLSDPWLQSSNY